MESNWVISSTYSRCRRRDPKVPLSTLVAMCTRPWLCTRRRTWDWLGIRAHSTLGFLDTLGLLWSARDAGDCLINLTSSSIHDYCLRAHIGWKFTATSSRLVPEKFYGFSRKSIETRREVPRGANANDQPEEVRDIVMWYLGTVYCANRFCMSPIMNDMLQTIGKIHAENWSVKEFIQI